MSELDIIFSKSEPREETLTYKGIEFKLKTRELSWSERNQILSKSMVYEKDGVMSLNVDKYMKETLKKIIIEAPWGKTDEIFFTNINPTFGSMLEKLVPKSFVEPDVSTFFGKELSA